MTSLVLAVRTLRRSPSFVLGVVLTLGIALAVTVFVFTLTNNYLLRPLPYGDSERLAVVYEYSIKTGRENFSRVPFGNAVDVIEQSRSLRRAAILRNESVTVQGRDGTEVAFVQRVSPVLFPMIGTRAALGRTLNETDAAANAEPAVVLSDSLWRRRFGADPAIVGKRVRFDRRDYVVTGVLPATFRIPTFDDNPQAWIALPPSEYRRNDRIERRHHVLVELTPGHTVSSFQSEVDAIASDLRRSFPATNGDRAFLVTSLRDDLVGIFGQLLLLLQAAVLLVLAAACLNSLCLLIARSLQRRREVAVRLALGASQRHLFTQLFMEALGLTLPAAGLALVLVAGSLPALLRLVPAITALQAVGTPTIDVNVIAAVIAAAVVIALVFSAVPLLQSRRLPLESTLRDGGRLPGSSAGSKATRWLVVAQVAVSLALLVSALLLLRSQHRLAHVDLGYAVSELDQFRIGLRGETFRDPQRRLAFYRQVSDNLRELPGIVDVGAMTFLTVEPPAGYQGFTEFGDGLLLTDTPKRAAVRGMDPHLFSVIGLTLLSGRPLSENDTAECPGVAVVSASLARKHWPEGNALGKRVQFDTAEGRWYQIVGIVSDMQGLGSQPRPVDSFYLSLAQHPVPGLGIGMLLRMKGPFLPSETLQKAVWNVDPNMQFFRHQAVAETYEQSAWQTHAMVVVIGTFALLALALTLGGIYAVNSFRVAQRVPEFGVRLALGATAAAVGVMVLRENFRLTLLGLLSGTAVAVISSLALRGFLFSAAWLDPVAYFAAVSTMALACSGAAWLPAVRASRVTPCEALRTH
ncbi:MAG: ADOP family duplicated permease [Opitutaceae bacterium]